MSNYQVKRLERDLEDLRSQLESKEVEHASQLSVCHIILCSELNV